MTYRHIFLITVLLTATGWQGAGAALLDDRYLGEQSKSRSKDFQALQTSISLELQNVPFGRALRTIAEKASIRLNYNESVIPINRKVTVSQKKRPAIEALRNVLKQTGTAYVISGNGQIMIVPAKSKPKTGTVKRLRLPVPRRLLPATR